MRPLIPLLLALLTALPATADVPAGEDALGSRSYDDYERPETCAACHVDFYRQWRQSMMSQAYVHHWDEIEYFELAVPHAEKDAKVAGVKAGCNGCHAPLSFLAGDVPPPASGRGLARRGGRVLRPLPHHHGLRGRHAPQLQLDQ